MACDYCCSAGTPKYHDIQISWVGDAKNPVVVPLNFVKLGFGRIYKILLSNGLLALTDQLQLQVKLYNLPLN